MLKCRDRILIEEVVEDKKFPGFFFDAKLLIHNKRVELHLSLLLISQDASFLMFHLTRGLVPTSLNSPGFDLSPRTFFIFLLTLVFLWPQNSGSSASVFVLSRLINVTENSTISLTIKPPQSYKNCNIYRLKDTLKS